MMTHTRGLETRKETMARSVLCVIGKIDTHYKSIHTCVNSLTLCASCSWYTNLGIVTTLYMVE
jgi:hypothetical protein